MATIQSAGRGVVGRGTLCLGPEALALPALGGLLWNPASTAALNAASLTGTTGVELSNADFLEVLRQLAFTRQGTVLRPWITRTWARKN